MAEERVQRRLAAILAADIVGYSRLVAADEAGTLSMLKSLRKTVLEPLVAKFQGRVFKLVGDGAFVEFGSAVNAVLCAMELQQAIARGACHPDRQITLRVGINLGDVIVEGGDLYGDGVNVAARLEGLADPGGVVISGSVHDQVRTKIKASFDDLGPIALKNIPDPVRAYRVAGAARVAASAGIPRSKAAKPSIVVLPFSNVSGDPEQEYFSEGITKDIIAGLSRFHEIVVITAPSAAPSATAAAALPHAVAQGGSRYVVEGSLRKLGERVRIAVQLTDSSTGIQLWAERYDRELAEIFAVQDELTRAIVAKVTGRVIQATHEKTLHTSPEHLLAYDCWLRGQHQLLLWTAEADLQATMWFEKALAKDPHFARAHSSLALVLNGKIVTKPGYSDAERDLARAVQHARLAVQYDNEDARCHAGLAWVSLSSCDLGRAKRHFELALQLNPNAPDNLINCGLGFAFLGDPARGKALAEYAKDLNPLHGDWYDYLAAEIHFLSGEFEACFEVGHPFISSFLELSGWTAAALGLLDRQAEAKREGRRFLEEVAACWAGQTPMTAEDALAWFMAINGFLKDETKRLLLEGLEKAGLPVPSLHAD